MPLLVMFALVAAVTSSMVYAETGSVFVTAAAVIVALFASYGLLHLLINLALPVGRDDC